MPQFHHKVAALIVLLFGCGNALAVDFPLYDARTASMGGAGIAQAIPNAAFYNPALAALEPEKMNWYLLAPSTGEVEIDPEKIEDALREGTLGSKLGGVYQNYQYDTLQLTIPSPVLGGTLYVAEYDVKTAKVVTDGTDNFLEHRSLEAFELGFGVAKLVDFMWMESVMLGATAKMTLLESYGYRDPAASASLTLKDDEGKRDSALNIDLGIAKEYGVWKTALVLKNLFKHENQLGNSSDDYTLAPQLRAAIAYKSRRAVVELDLDLLKNDGVGYASDTLSAGIGWEWRMFPAFMLRLGYNQNFQGEKLSTFTGGIGLVLWGLQIDVAASGNEDGSGAFVQAGWTFSD
jgi:hypothetical protein